MKPVVDIGSVQLLAVFAENRAGQLARVARVLAQAGVNIRWIAIASGEGYGVVKLLADQTDVAHQRLEQDGLPVSRLDVLAIEVEDKPGGLFRVTEILARHAVNVENASGFVVAGRAILLIEVKDPASARTALERDGLRVLSTAETMRF